MEKKHKDKYGNKLTKKNKRTEQNKIYVRNNAECFSV